MSENKEAEQVEVGTFACTNCGAELKFKPGTSHLVCDYCGEQNEIPELDESIEELDFHTYLAQEKGQTETVTERVAKCGECGATATIDATVAASSCPYCTTPYVVGEIHNETLVKPGALLPFKLKKQEARQEFKKWIEKMWWAPGDLKKATLSFDHFNGVYIPYWTFDAQTQSQYIGQRGINYQETRKVNGETQTVTKTRWHTVTGTITHFFNDILVVASKTLPDKYIQKLEPWDLHSLVPFDKNYLSGFITERYQKGLEEGFMEAKGLADERIRGMIRKDIGGDAQQISSVKTAYEAPAFKHVLLPVYVSAYKFKGKLYQFLINGRSGEVQGERPLSTTKIALAILGGLAVIALIYFLTK